jgi:predicted DNA-binding protein
MSITIELEKDNLEFVEFLAKDRNKDVNHIINQIIDEYLERLSDERLLEIAKERSADVRSGKSKTYSFKEVLNECGLSD